MYGSDKSNICMLLCTCSISVTNCKKISSFVLQIIYPKWLAVLWQRSTNIYYMYFSKIELWLDSYWMKNCQHSLQGLYNS